MLKVILDCVAFARLYYVINLENLYHLLNRSGTNLKLMATCIFLPCFRHFDSGIFNMIPGQFSLQRKFTELKLHL